MLERLKKTWWEMDFEEYTTCASELPKVTGTQNAMDRKSVFTCR